MVRIVAGKHRSRQLKTLEGDVSRPTLDQIKESFFNTIGPYFHDCTVLDGFGGSGAIGLEFISRYAAHVTVVEKNSNAVRVIESNIKLLKEEQQVTLVADDLIMFLTRVNDCFDIIYLDPPYNFGDYQQLFNTLKHVCHRQTKVYYESDLNEEIEPGEDFELLWKKAYRRTKISCYSLKKEVL